MSVGLADAVERLQHRIDHMTGYPVHVHCILLASFMRIGVSSRATILCRISQTMYGVPLLTCTLLPEVSILRIDGHLRGTANCYGTRSGVMFPPGSTTGLGKPCALAGPLAVHDRPSKWCICCHQQFGRLTIVSLQIQRKSSRTKTPTGPY